MFFCIFVKFFFQDKFSNIFILSEFIDYNGELLFFILVSFPDKINFLFKLPYFFLILCFLLYPHLHFNKQFGIGFLHALLHFHAPPLDPVEIFPHFGQNLMIGPILNEPIDGQSRSLQILFQILSIMFSIDQLLLQKGDLLGLGNTCQVHSIRVVREVFIHYNGVIIT